MYIKEVEKVKTDIIERVDDYNTVSDYLKLNETERARIERALSVIQYKADNLTIKDIEYDRLKEIK